MGFQEYSKLPAELHSALGQSAADQRRPFKAAKQPGARDMARSLPRFLLVRPLPPPSAPRSRSALLHRLR